MFVVMTAICVLLGVFLAVTPQVALAAILMTAHAGVAAIWGAILGAAIVSTRSLKLGLAIGGISGPLVLLVPVSTRPTAVMVFDSSSFSPTSSVFVYMYLLDPHGFVPGGTCLLRDLARAEDE